MKIYGLDKYENERKNGKPYAKIQMAIQRIPAVCSSFIYFPSALASSFNSNLVELYFSYMLQRLE